MSLTYIIAIAACGLLLIAIIVVLAMFALSGARPAGTHARRPKPAAQDEADPFADPDDGADPDEAADEYIGELRGTAEPEPAPVLAAPAPETLEPLPPPLDRRERTVTIAALPAWEPPVDRGTLESIRDALRALPSAPAAEPEPESAYDPAGENTQQIFLRLVGGKWSPAEMAARIAADACGDAAPKDSADKKLDFTSMSLAGLADDGDEERADFAGVSVAGLPDDGWDLAKPVALNGKHHATGNEAVA